MFHVRKDENGVLIFWTMQIGIFLYTQFHYELFGQLNTYYVYKKQKMNKLEINVEHSPKQNEVSSFTELFAHFRFF